MSDKVNLENIKKLREITGVGFKDCKIAIDENNGDIEKSIELFNREGYDSILSVSRAADRFIWHLNEGKPEALNYDFKNRKMRQKIKQTFIENGSFYLFKPSFLKQHNNRLAGKIGFFELEYFKMFQIDEIEDVRFCEMIMREYL